MFENFFPDETVSSTYEIDFQTLYEEGYRGVLFDIDNTLVEHGKGANEQAIRLFERLRKIGFQCCLISNNKKKRVSSFNDKIGVHMVFDAHKPGCGGYLEAMRKMGTNRENTVFVGDQLFTDIWGAKRVGIRNILVKPISRREEIQIIAKRYLENIVLHEYRKKRLERKKMQGTLISSPANMRSSVGFRGEGIVFVSETLRLVFTDSRYTVAAKAECGGAEVITCTGNLYESWLKMLLERLGKDVVSSMTIGFEDEVMTVQSYRTIRALFRKYQVEDVKLVPLHKRLDAGRQIKTEDEIAKIKRAEQIGDLAFDKIVKIIRKSRTQGTPLTEKQVAAYLEFYMKEQGADGTSFDTIAASGLHSAMPHAVPTDKVLEEGDFLTMDFGCKVDGYCSDMTRTVVIGKANEKQREIYETVLRAQQAAIDMIKPGMKGCEVDSIAREIIQEAGYGDCFGHSLGHSVGLMIHETPCFSPKDESVLKPGMVITVEPGVYVEGFGGVRIEDVVVVTEDGCVDITHSPKELMEIGEI